MRHLNHFANCVSVLGAIGMVLGGVFSILTQDWDPICWSMGIFIFFGVFIFFQTADDIG